MRGDFRGERWQGDLSPLLVSPFFYPPTPQPSETPYTQANTKAPSTTTETKFIKCWRIFLEFNSKGLYLCLEKEKENRSPVNVFTSTADYR